ncbi:hypothetical protein BGZ97_005235 [Linnemannia gamsii]|uniref:FAD-binding domain-containing protein n=1 Tax=Linnemannia gamsii TaxID=64522 RepID=A0A9P6UGB8_9FUNG|nr:hypothetical protein BGZ97_005235 [Linnemannia gamsii]
MAAHSSPEVIIAGGGLGGLFLGALFEKSGTPYIILERSSTVKAMGSAISIGATLLPLFDQLGLLDDFVAIGKPSVRCLVNREGDQVSFVNDFELWKEYTGYQDYMIGRPELHNLLLRQIPPEKMHFGKRVLTIKEEDNRVKVITADGSSFEGDILVGADGAYSAVRQRLYDILRKEGKLPKSDQEDLPFSCTCLVGQTKPLDPEKYPLVKEPLCQFLTTLGKDKPYSWALFTTAQDSICFVVIHHLDKVSSKVAEEQRFRSLENAEWGPCTAKAMCEQTRAFPIPGGSSLTTMGDIYDLTPPELISKVMLEEKVFDTWSHGRIVLLGDACHKMTPSAAQGAMVAMHDAAALANLIYALPSNYTTKDIDAAFQEYKEERYPPALESFKSSQLMGKAIDKGIGGMVGRFIMQHKPDWLWRMILKGMVKNRPLVGFLRPVPAKGTVPPNISASEVKARAVFQQRLAATTAAGSV